MDAYDLSGKMKKIWADNADKNSGGIDKKLGDIRVCVWTNEGYREVVGVRYNQKLKMIELEMDAE